MKTKKLLYSIILLLPISGYAYQLSPSFQEPEGTSIVLTITIESIDWRLPNQQYMDYCNSIGYPAVTWVATYNIIGVSDSADFGSGPKDGDLHFVVAGAPHSPNDFWIKCSEAVSNPGPEVESFYSIELNADHRKEAMEHAVAEIYDHDFDDNLTFHDSIDIYIEDTAPDDEPVTPCVQDAIEKIGWVELDGGAVLLLECNRLPKGGYRMLYQRECIGGDADVFVDIDPEYNDCFVSYGNFNCANLPDFEWTFHPPYASKAELRADAKAIAQLCRFERKEN